MWYTSDLDEELQAGLTTKSAEDQLEEPFIADRLKQVEKELMDASDTAAFSAHTMHSSSGSLAVDDPKKMDVAVSVESLWKATFLDLDDDTVASACPIFLKSVQEIDPDCKLKSYRTYAGNVRERYIIFILEPSSISAFAEVLRFLPTGQLRGD